jgi:hypothetical protein
MGTSHADEFREQGYTVARAFFTADECRELAGEVERRMKDPDTYDPLTQNGLVFTQNVFKKSKPCQALISQQKLIDFLRPIAGGDLWVRWDQAVTKRPGGGVFRWHQDNGYNGLLTEHYQVWIALTESKNQNGGLWLAPGSHKRGPLHHERAPGAQIECTAEIGDSLCIDATIGDLIVFSSYMLHRTGPNEADRARLAYVAEYMPCSDYDFGVSGPFFVAARDGVSRPHFVRLQPGLFSLKNQKMYLMPRVRRFVRRVKKLGGRLRPATT